jgi:hypothetical protein
LQPDTGKLADGVPQSEGSIEEVEVACRIEGGTAPRYACHVSSLIYLDQLNTARTLQNQVLLRTQELSFVRAQKCLMDARDAAGVELSGINRATGLSKALTITIGLRFSDRTSGGLRAVSRARRPLLDYALSL